MGFSFSDWWSNSDRSQRLREETASLLPAHGRDAPSAISAEEVTKVALRLRYQIETIVPVELEAEVITKANSPIITSDVIKTAKQAGGVEYKDCVVYALLICMKWFKRQANLELWDADLLQVRAIACEIIAKRIIEAEEDTGYLMEHILLKRFATISHGQETSAANVIERAVDLHALTVIGSSGYQKCVAYLWRGWMSQDDGDPSRFTPYKGKANTSYYAHFDPDRVRVPQYQNTVFIAVSIIYLILYTISINTINRDADIDVIEGILYVFTLGFACDELTKFWKIGRYYISFWNLFNLTLYTLLAVSFILRMVALGHPEESDQRIALNTNSYNFLAFCAPFFWMRLMLYFDSFRFFGTMLVVVKEMMKESLIFFALLIIVIIGFLQAFLGLDEVDQELQDISFVAKAMVNAIMTSPDFDGFENFGHPFGLILYYLYTFVVMVILLNILVALYNSAYSDITDRSDEEFMALVAQKCLQFVRAPDENVYIPPFNLVELFLVIPLSLVLNKDQYERVNDVIMGVLYSPLLLVTSAFEVRTARRVERNRKRGDADEDTVEEWAAMDWDVEEEDHAWKEEVEKSMPDVKMQGPTKDIAALKAQVQEMKEMLQKITEGKLDVKP